MSQSKAVPDLNPFIALPVICPTCGKTILPSVKKQANGRVIGLEYIHRNEESGCSYRIEASGERVNGQIFLLPKEAKA